MQLTERAISVIKPNIKCLAHLMIEFNRGQWTILDWLDPAHVNHTNLTHPIAIKIISEYTGLSKDEILEEIPANAERLSHAV